MVMRKFQCKTPAESERKVLGDQEETAEHYEVPTSDDIRRRGAEACSIQEG